MDPLLLSVIIGLISAFLAKKNGAEDGKAALIGAAAGLGTYYVATETEWGKALIGDVDQEWVNSGVVDANGKAVYIPKGSTVSRNPDGSIKVNADGSWWTGGTSIGDVLKDWGPAGTAGVIGSVGVATGAIDLKGLLPWILGGVAILLLVK